MQSIFAYKKVTVGSLWQAKGVKIKAVGRSLKGKKTKLNQVTFAHLSHYTQHVAYSSKVKSQDNPSPSVHCYLSLRIHSKRDSNDFTAGYI